MEENNLKNKKIGAQTVKLSTPIRIIETSSIVSKKEGEGPLGKYFDKVIEDSLYDEDSWEKAESKFICENIKNLLLKAKMKKEDIDYLISGDLLDQCTGSTFGIEDFKIPFLGIFGACSTMGEGISIGSMLLDGGFGKYIIASASSHFCGAEKQFRTPLALGNQRPPTTTWTVTGAGALILSKEGDYPKITHITTGKIIDMGITDANNMGAAMAPAAVDLLINHFKDTGRTPKDYDVIATGDLGEIGKNIVISLLAEENYILDEIYTDCGIEIYDNEAQDTHCGGSGCACSATTFSSYFYPKLCKGEINRMLFIPTGALMSVVSSGQGRSIPAIAHGIVIESNKK